MNDYFKKELYYLPYNNKNNNREVKIEDNYVINNYCILEKRNISTGEYQNNISLMVNQNITIISDNHKEINDILKNTDMITKMNNILSDIHNEILTDNFKELLSKDICELPDIVGINKKNI